MVEISVAFFLKKKAKEIEYTFLRYKPQILKIWNSNTINSGVLNTSCWNHSSSHLPFAQHHLYIQHPIYFYWQLDDFSVHWSRRKDQAVCKRNSPVISNPLKELDPPDSLCSHTQTTLQVDGVGRDQLGKERFPSSWFKKKQRLQRTLETWAWMRNSQLQRHSKVTPQTHASNMS